MSAWRRSKIAVGLAVLPLLSACNLLVSLDELSGAGAASDGGAGGAGARGGAGGEGAAGGRAGAGGAGAQGAGGGGAAGGSALGTVDWSGSFEAVWRFEQAPPQLGLNSGFGDADLTEVGLPGRNTSDAQEGSASLELFDTHRLVSNGTVFAAAPTDSFTIGGWFKSADGPTAAVLGKMGSGNPGYVLEYLQGGTGKCYWADDANAYLAQAPNDSWLPGLWVHFACRYDADAGELTVVVDGTPGVSVTATLTPSPAPFSISDAISPYAGLVDEAFFVREALSYASLARVRACGIDGAACQCNAGDPTAYDNCGRAEPNCQSLPACNAAAP